MNTQLFSEAMGELDGRYIDEALHYKRRAKMPRRAKFAAAAACFAVVAVLCAGLIGSRLFKSTDTVTLAGGEKLVFVKSDDVGGAPSLAVDVTLRALTSEEAEALFPDLSVTAVVYFKNDEAGSPQELIGFEGKIGDVSMIISSTDIRLVDTVVIGTEETCEICGTAVTAGYFVTRPNSRGERTSIYYAVFELGGWTVYLEKAGLQADSEATKEALAQALYALIENGGSDFSSLSY